MMETGALLDVLRREGGLLGTAASGPDLDTPIPTCPEWRLGDLVRHMGDVHRWAAAHVAEGRLKPIGREELPKVAGPPPDDADLLDWFREGHAALVRTLETADPDTTCWSFLPAPSPLAFWVRRQAHETGIHRADAESPGGRITPFAPDVAVDGIEELLFGFLAGSDQESQPDPRPTLSVQATDIGAEWLVRMGSHGAVAERGRGDADCSVRGPASDLHLLLWNRRHADGLDVAGDRSVLDRWRETVRITWSRAR